MQRHFKQKMQNQSAMELTMSDNKRSDYENFAYHPKNNPPIPADKNLKRFNLNPESQKNEVDP